MKPLELGLTPWATDASGSTATLEPLVGQSVRAEALGFGSIWFPESHFSGPGAVPAPLLLLAAIGARTRSLRLGTTSYLLPIRHPLHVAAEIAVLDRLSGGRVILGVGRGFRSSTFAAFSVPTREKRDRFEAALAVMQRAWSGEPVAEEGEQPVRLAPLPLQQPHPPIWVAAFGPKALAQAGRLGLPYLASPMESLQRLLENRERHREALEEAGVDGELAVPIMRTAFVTRDASVEERVRDGLEKQIAALRSSAPGGLRRAAPDSIDDYALVGTPEAVTEGVACYREQLGMTHLIVRGQVPGAEPAQIEQSLELVAELCQGDGV